MSFGDWILLSFASIFIATGTILVSKKMENDKREACRKTCIRHFKTSEYMKDVSFTGKLTCYCMKDNEWKLGGKGSAIIWD